MAYNLFKIAKELNVATSTIVEYLTSKGIEVENKPIAKFPMKFMKFAPGEIQQCNGGKRKGRGIA